MPSRLFMALAMACAVGAGMSSPARAADVPFDINRFAPAFGTGRFVTLDLAEIAPRLEIAPQIFVNYSKNPLYLYIGNQPQFPIISDKVTGDIGLSVGIPINGTGRLQFGLSLPVTFYQNGNGDMVATMFAGTQYINLLPTQTIKSAGQEDLRFQIKGVFVNGRLGGLGAAADLTVPTGDGNSFLGNPLPTGNLKLLGHLNFWKFTVALNVGWLFADNRQIVFTNTGMSFTYGLGLGLKVAKWDSGSFDILTEVYGLSYKDFAHLGEAPMEGTAALRLNIKEWHIYLGAGPGIPPNYAKGIGTPEYRVYAGLQFAWQKKPPAPPPPYVPPPPDCRCKGPNCACQPGVNCPCTPGVNCRCTPGVDCPCTAGKDCACEEGKTCGCTPGVNCPCTPGVDCLCTAGKDCPAAKPIRLLGESFEFDRPELSETGQKTIEKEIDKLVDLINHGGKIRVEGHTDNVGNRDYNTGLSYGRAKNVNKQIVDLLTAKGVGEDVISRQVLPFGWYADNCLAVASSKVLVKGTGKLKNGKLDPIRILRDSQNEPNRRIEINQHPDDGIKCLVPLPPQQ